MHAICDLMAIKQDMYGDNKRVLWREWGWRALKGVFWGLLALRKHRVSKREWTRRMRVCYKCTIFDKEYKACRLGTMGCGCYTPFSNLVKDECWMREKYGVAFGWSAKDGEDSDL